MVYYVIIKLLKLLDARKEEPSYLLDNKGFLVVNMKSYVIKIRVKMGDENGNINKVDD